MQHFDTTLRYILTSNRILISVFLILLFTTLIKHIPLLLRATESMTLFNAAWLMTWTKLIFPLACVAGGYLISRSIHQQYRLYNGFVFGILYMVIVFFATWLFEYYFASSILSDTSTWVMSVYVYGPAFIALLYVSHVIWNLRDQSTNRRFTDVSPAIFLPIIGLSAWTALSALLSQNHSLFREITAPTPEWLLPAFGIFALATIAYSVYKKISLGRATFMTVVACCIPAILLRISLFAGITGGTIYIAAAGFMVATAYYLYVALPARAS